jgi:hypothetical protein
MKPIELTLRSARRSGAARLPGRNLFALAVIFAFTLMFSVAPQASAQLGGSVSGQILDIAGKPWVDIGVEAVSDQGAKSSAITDKNGNFTFTNLRAGEYSISVLLPPPNQPYMAAKIRVSSGSEAPKVNINFKEIAGKQGKEFAEAQKKQEEEKQKFQGMKAHFDAGAGFLTQELTMGCQKLAAGLPVLSQGFALAEQQRLKHGHRRGLHGQGDHEITRLTGLPQNRREAS